MTFFIDLWVVITGTIIGFGSVYMARGRHKFIKAGATGAIIAVIMGFLRGLV